MILSFKPEFEQKIKEGTKIHTLRSDNADRWHKGRKIHFWVGNPRNKSKNPRQFDFGVCTGIQWCKLSLYDRKILIFPINLAMNELPPLSSTEGYKKLSSDFWKNDGFDCEDDFWNFFQNMESPVIYAKIVHWTEFAY